MIYGYIRVSTDKQDLENQRFELLNFAKANSFEIDDWIDETISGAKDYKKRALFPLMKKLKSGDRIVCAELSRLGRELMMIMEILRYCLENGIEIWTHKDNYRLGNDIQSKVLAFAFGLSAEIERNLISQRTKEALKKKKEDGVILGRPKGRKSQLTKLSGKESLILHYASDLKYHKAKIARRLHVNRGTLSRFINDTEQLRNLNFPKYGDRRVLNVG